MKKNIINIIFLIIFVFLNSSCEIATDKAIYIYKQDSDNIFVDKSKEDQLIDLSFFPTKSFEDERIGKFVGNYILDDNAKEKIKNKIDTFLNGFYYCPYIDDNSKKFDQAKLILSQELSKNMDVIDYFKSIKVKITELESEMNIESMKIEGKINKYINNNNKVIFRVPCQIKVDLEGGNAQEITQSYQSMFKGNANNIELFLYFIENNTDLKLYSWIESYRNPFQSIYFSQSGIEVLEKTQENLWNIEDDYDKLKANFDNIEYVNDLSELEHNKLLQLNYDFLESFFNYDSNQKLTYINKNLSLFNDDKNAIEVWVNELDSNEVKLTYFGQKDQGYIAYKGKKQDSTYYCVITNNAYEAYSHSLSLSLKNRKIPTGSLFVHSLFVFEKTENGFKLYDWGLGGFSRKSPGFGYLQTLQDFN